MREDELLAHIYARSADLTVANRHIIVGPGDDCAVIRVDPDDPDRDLLLKVDQLVEHRHFHAHTDIDLIARKAIARAVSDIAAMGGRPLCALAAGVLPPRYAHADNLFDSLSRWARHFNAPLVGGDIAVGPGLPAPGMPLCLSITLTGAVHPTRGPVLRSTARPGDDIWVTGCVGGSFTSGRHLTFEPRLREAAQLCDTLGDTLHAMMDISDGLGRDAGRMARASGVKLVIDGAKVPLGPDAKDPLSAAADGEDYELLFCTAPGIEVAAPPGLAPFTRIGRVEAGSGSELVLSGGRRIDASELGWEHE